MFCYGVGRFGLGSGYYEDLGELVGEVFLRFWVNGLIFLDVDFFMGILLGLWFWL